MLSSDPSQPDPPDAPSAPEGPVSDASLKSLGRGMVQLNRRLARVLEAVEKGSGVAPGLGENLPAELLFDLLEAVDAVLDDATSPRSHAGSLGATPPRSRWPARAARRLWQRVLRSGHSETQRPLPPALRGLALARDQALDQLARRGVEPIACSGAFDPALHHVIDTEPTRQRELHETLVHTYRRGWCCGRGADRRVLRHAQVRLHRHQEA